MDSYRLQQTSTGKIGLEKGTHELEPIKAKQVFGPEPEQIEALSAILKELNERFGTDFTDADKVFIEHLEAKLNDDAALQTSVKVNVPENARLTFDHVANDKIQELIDTNFKFYKQINDDAEFAKFFLDWLFERYQKQGEQPGEGERGVRTHAERSWRLIPRTPHFALRTPHPHATSVTASGLASHSLSRG